MFEIVKHLVRKHAENRKDAFLEGTCEEDHVYVYNGYPLCDVENGETFYAKVITRPVTLKSETTGTVWHTATDGGVALSYDGVVFGATSCYEKTFRALADEGYHIKVKMRRTGMYARKVPKVQMLLPPKAAMDLMRDTGKAIPPGSDVIVLGVSGWDGPKRDFDAPLKTYWIKPSQGSKAKPKIGINFNGTKVHELTARSQAYKPLSAHVGETPLIATCTRHKSTSGDSYERIALAFSR